MKIFLMLSKITEDNANVENKWYFIIVRNIYGTKKDLLEIKKWASKNENLIESLGDKAEKFSQ